MSEMKDMILDVVERMLKENVDKDLVDVVEKGQCHLKFGHYLKKTA